MENEILSGRFNRLLQKLLSMKGPSPSPQVSGDIIPTLPLEMDRPEWGFLREEALFMGRANHAADAANLAYVGLFNGQVTNALIVIEQILLVNSNAGAIFVDLIIGNTTGLTGVSRFPSTDLRWLNKNSVGQVGSGVEAALTGTRIGRINLLANTSLLVPLKVILPPNAAVQPFPPNLVIECPTVNNAVEATFFWRERRLEESEGPVPGA